MWKSWSQISWSAVCVMLPSEGSKPSLWPQRLELKPEAVGLQLSSIVSVRCPSVRQAPSKEETKGRVWFHHNVKKQLLVLLEKILETSVRHPNVQALIQKLIVSL